MISSVATIVRGRYRHPWRLVLLLLASLLAVAVIALSVHPLAIGVGPRPLALHKEGHAFKCQGPNHLVTGTLHGPFPIPPAERRETSQLVLEVDYQITETNKNRRSIGEMMDHWIGLNDAPELHTPTGKLVDALDGIWKFDHPEPSGLPYEFGPSRVRFEVQRGFPGSSLDGWKFVIGADSAPGCSFTLHMVPAEGS